MTTQPQDLPAALDDVADGDEHAGDPVEAEHDLDPSTFEEETDD